jgi:LmbE family N-acetylglucosaminyl deacetylase
MTPPEESRRRPPAVIAIAAHPDDIEFYMAGTLLLLKEAGWTIHYLTLASGSCGSLQYSAAATKKLRRTESRRAAAILGAHYHPSLVDDFEVLYNLRILRNVASLIRLTRPSIVLTHSPRDYMEDHVNTSRLAVSAAFARGMPNFRATPARAPTPEDVTVYHAMPHGLRDELGRRVPAGAFVNTTPVHHLKRKALAAHQSQKTWLDASQGMDSYLKTMDKLSRAVGRMSGRFQHAEGWRRHLHYGFCPEESDPLRRALASAYFVNSRYKRQLEKEF